MYYFITFLFFISSVISMEQQESNFRIGFEFEFPYYGISKKNQQKVEKKPILTDKQKVWALYRDTLDSKVEKAYFEEKSDGIWNLEFKTFKNGISLDEPQKFLEAIDQIDETLNKMSQLQYGPEQFGEKFYQSALLSKNNILNQNTDYSFPSEDLFLVKKEEN